MTGHREKQTVKKRILQILGAAVGAVAVLALGLVVVSNSGQAAAQTLAEVQGIGRLVRVVTFRSYRDQLPSGRGEARVDTLMVHGLSDAALQQKINDALADWSDKMVARYHSDLEEIGIGGGRESLDCRLGRVTMTDRFLSVQLCTTIAQGSAQELTRWYTADLETGELLTLSDLFAEGADYVGAVSSEIRGQMERALQENPRAGWLLRSEEEPLGFWEIDPQQAFTLTEDGRLVIVFDEGEVGISALGSVEFEIPAEVTGPLRTQNSPLAEA